MYYREIPGSTDTLEREYFIYETFSGDEPVPIKEDMYWNVAGRVNRRDEALVVASPGGMRAAFTNTYDIYIHHDPDGFFEIQEDFSVGYALVSERGDLRMGDYFDYVVEGDLLVIGSICWDYDGRKLYFDNSGLDYRCIWEFDVEGQTVKKIIPEHEAIHPWFYTHFGNRCVAYTEGNQLKLSTEYWAGP
jgi:hypothetical protein